MPTRGRKKGTLKTGGAKPGTLPRKTVATMVAVQELCVELDYDPHRELIRMAQDKTLDLSLRVACHREIARYLRPQMRSVEHSGTVGHEPLEINITWHTPE